MEIKRLYPTYVAGKSLKIGNDTYSTEYYAEEVAFGVRFSFRARKSNEGNLCFTVSFPPSYFGGKSANTNVMRDLALDKIREAIENRKEEVTDNQGNILGCEINCPERSDM